MIASNCLNLFNNEIAHAEDRSGIIGGNKKSQNIGNYPLFWDSQKWTGGKTNLKLACRGLR